MSEPSWVQAFPRPQALAAAVERIGDWLRSRGLLETLPDHLSKVADPAQALVNLEELVRRDVEPDEEILDPLLRVFGASQSLSRSVLADPEDGLTWFRRALSLETVSFDDHVSELMQTCGDALADPGVPGRLRKHRHRHVLRIGARDLTGRATVEETVRELSVLAAGCIELGLRHARARTEEDHGAIGNLPFVVLGMGKLGGLELNFSSDVDLVYLYERAQPRSEGGSRGAVDAQAFATRMAEILTRAVGDVTEEGIVFRVDLRLRPDGQNGPLVNSVTNALTYYESWGKTWERAAMLKARPVAGDLDLGERFLQEMRPFVYRRYLDYETVEEIQTMRGRVESAHSPDHLRNDVKLGPGGIREIEFVVQGLQLVHGGRDERLQVRSTLGALEALAAVGLVDEHQAHVLGEAYRFLRDVEHKIQIVHERQTQRLPTSPEEERLLARRLGHVSEGEPSDADPAAEAQRFREALERYRRSVREFFEQFFFGARREVEREVDHEIRRLLEEVRDQETTAERLGRMGFREPDRAAEHLLRIRQGAGSGPPSRRREKAIRNLAPALLAELRRSSDPDMALRHMESFVAAVGARTSFLALLVENPETLRLLVGLFATSPYLSDFFLRHPELLDSLVRADLAKVRKDPEELRADLASFLSAAQDFEAELDVLRRFRNEEFLRVGVNDIHGLLENDEVAEQLSDLADVTIDAALDIASRIVKERFGSAPGRFLVLGMGKLGGRELAYNSDLDLIFVYERAGDGGPEMSAHEFFTKLAQRFISVLQARTPEGIVYAVDTRLRPSGTAGPLVSSLEAFRRYHGTDAGIWERQALTRARGVAGDSDLREKVDAQIDEFVYGRGLDPTEAVEIARIRTRMENELAAEGPKRWNIKTGRGGIVDIEFTVQMLQLRHGHDHPAVRVQHTGRALDVLREERLLSDGDYRTLCEGYRFLRQIESRLRIQGSRASEAVEPEEREVEALARRLGYEGDPDVARRRLLEDLERVRWQVREAYGRLFGELTENG